MAPGKAVGLVQALLPAGNLQASLVLEEGEGLLARVEKGGVYRKKQTGAVGALGVVVQDLRLMGRAVITYYHETHPKRRAWPPEGV